MADYASIVSELEKILHLRTSAIGLKFCREASELDGIEGLVRVEHPLCLCQAFGLSRIAHKTLGLLPADVAGGTPESFGNCASIFGLSEPTEFIRSGEMMAGGCYATLADSKAEQDAIDRLEPESVAAIAMGPASVGNMEPDVVAFYGTPGQMMALMNGLQHSEYEPITICFVGESSCSDAYITCYRTGKPAGSIPCMGERQRGGAEDNEMILCVPPQRLEAALEGVQAWNRVGCGYPVLPFGTQCDPATPAAVNVYQLG